MLRIPFAFSVQNNLKYAGKLRHMRLHYQNQSYAATEATGGSSMAASLKRIECDEEGLDDGIFDTESSTIEYCIVRRQRENILTLGTSTFPRRMQFSDQGTRLK